jgi:hypothetical protein
MTALLADCPRTGKLLKVYIVRTIQTLADLNFKGTKILCKHCQEYHQFNKDDVYAEETEGEGRS